jgi:chaperonin cofactor prefoldin
MAPRRRYAGGSGIRNERQRIQDAAYVTNALNAYKDQIKSIDKNIKTEKENIKKDEKLIKGISDRLLTETNPTVIDNLLVARQTIRDRVTATKKKIVALEKQKVDVQNKINTIIGTKPPVDNKETTTSTTNTITENGGDVEFSTEYKYNAPLVSGAYLGQGISADSIGGTLDTKGFPINAPVFTDAYSAWRGVSGGRGTIQMDRQYVRNMANSQKESLKIDKQMYGFKFLYNPTTVSMGWGVQANMDPDYMSSGEEIFNPISANLITSTVVFEVLLNRIADFNHLKSDGSLIGSYPYGQIDVPIEERKQIYDRGTMYDLEYFFKTINGPRASFTSKYNGVTADAGWLLPSSLELHLGAGMRYRIRINEVSINHAIFNNRMVPILSTVRFVCGRYNDGPGTPIQIAPPPVDLARIRQANGGYI